MKNITKYVTQHSREHEVEKMSSIIHIINIIRECSQHLSEQGYQMKCPNKKLINININ